MHTHTRARSRAAAYQTRTLCEQYGTQSHINHELCGKCFCLDCVFQRVFRVAVVVASPNCHCKLMAVWSMSMGVRSIYRCFLMHRLDKSNRTCLIVNRMRMAIFSNRFVSTINENVLGMRKTVQDGRLSQQFSQFRILRA